MSTSLPAPEDISPTPPLSLFDHPSAPHVFQPPPAPEPKEITPVGHHQPHNDNRYLVNGESKQPSTQTSNSWQLPDDVLLLDSAATTPRLPPSRHGSDDLHLIPSNELDMPHGGQTSRLTALPRSLPSTKGRPPPSPRAALVTSFSELNVPRSSNSRSTAQHDLLPANKRSILDRIALPLRSSQHPSSQTSSPSLQPARTRSYGAMTDTRPSASLAEDIINHDRSVDARERPAQRADDPGAEERRNRSTSHSGRVEKRIEATLAKAEPSTTARSRKSSHLLGLFKDNVGQDFRKLPERVSSPLASDLKDGQDFPRAALPDAIAQGTSPQNRSPGLELQSRAVQSDQQKQDIASERIASGQSKRATTQDAAVAPPRVLEDLTKPVRHDVATEELQHHELAIPSQAGWEPRRTQSQQKPTTSSHAVIPTKDDEDVWAAPRVGTATNQGHLETSANRENEEESDKEEISSALYYPHQAPSPDTLERRKDARAASFGSVGLDHQGRLADPESAPDYDDGTCSEEVDIALQSQNQQRYLHGDLPKAMISKDDAPSVDGGLSSASESEYESLDESGRSTSGDEANLLADAELTPRASPGAFPSFLRPKPRKRLTRPAAPFGAVELKPYTHQVGGHSTVYKFSKRAVCKPLSNRENEFYEVVENQHPELLRFLPRYDFVP
ncbi:hypothetical protein XANCAGTX0491_004909 [Xanthoria calcicola]